MTRMRKRMRIEVVGGARTRISRGRRRRDTVAKYKPTPATSKITTMITTTIALEMA